MKKLVYYLEDDQNISFVVSKALNHIGLEVHTFFDYRLLFDEVKKTKPSLFLIDLMLPLIDGAQVVKHLKSKGSTAKIPIMVVSAKISDFDKVQCLDNGADDYLTKPFSMNELISRVRTLLRRNSLKLESYIYRDIVLKDVERTVYKNNIKIDLTYKEFELLKLLILNVGTAVKREQILQEVWGYDNIDNIDNSRTLDMHVKTIRQKLFTGIEAIETVFKYGYMLVYDEVLE